MRVKCISNKRDGLPEAIREMGFPEGSSDNIFDLTIGKEYEVYALRHDEEGDWYFVHTDTMNMDSFWWMTSSLYEVIDDTRSKGWVTAKLENSEAVMEAFPSLFDWRIEEGIIDGDEEAISKYQSEIDKNSFRN